MSSIQELLDMSVSSDTPVTVQGWIRTSRFSKRVTFLHLYDGSTTRTIQVVILPAASPEMKARLGVGTSIRVEGSLVPSPGSKQPTEVKCSEDGLTILGDCDASVYPIQKKDTSPEYLRTIPHLRVRTEEFQRVFLTRNILSAAIHDFFQKEGFMWVHTPILTSSDCEGAGEMFHVATPSKSLLDIGRPIKRHPAVGESITSVVASAVADDRPWPKPPLKDDQFFGEPAFLTVSGQLDVEAFACAFSKVYTFGPTFRAENSNTSRHASEFWMIEPEIAFATLEDVMDLAEDFVMHTIKSLNTHQGLMTLEVADIYSRRRLAERKEALRELGHDVPKVEVPRFARITHKEAMDILVKSGVDFEHSVGPRECIQTEHERYLADVHFRGPVFVTHYPAEHKSFYMRVTDPPEGEQWDGTVECFDLLVPGVGEIIGGSAREERLDVLIKSMGCHGMDPEDPAYQGYLDLRRYGTVPHGGFGLGLERLLMWVTGTKNIRDVLPYPRTPGVLS